MDTAILENRMAHDAAAEAAPEASVTGSRWRILIVDDHARVRETIRLILESYQEFEVIGEASDGEKALLQAELFRPDVVLMDIHLPIKNGVDATRALKQLLPELIIVGMSAQYSPRNYNSMIAAGAAAFFLKEDTASTLFRTIVYALTHGPRMRGIVETEEPHHPLRA